jgi:hypothetical protein
LPLIIIRYLGLLVTALHENLEDYKMHTQDRARPIR